MFDFYEWLEASDLKESMLGRLAGGTAGHMTNAVGAVRRFPGQVARGAKNWANSELADARAAYQNVRQRSGAVPQEQPEEELYVKGPAQAQPEPEGLYVKGPAQQQGRLGGLWQRFRGRAQAQPQPQPQPQQPQTQAQSQPQPEEESYW